MLAFTMFVITLRDIIGTIILSLIVLGMVGYPVYHIVADWWIARNKHRGD